MKLFSIALYLITSSLSLLLSAGFAANSDDPFVLIPEAESKENAANTVDLLANPAGDGKRFWKAYNAYGDMFTEEKDLGGSLASGVVTRDTILLMLIQVVKFIANMALVVGAAMIIYAGYIYVMSVYAGDNTTKANEAIKDAAIGVVIVVFSYAIQRIVTQAFLS